MKTVDVFMREMAGILGSLDSNDRKQIMDNIFFSHMVTASDMRKIKDSNSFGVFQKKFMELKQSDLLPGLIIINNEDASIFG